VFSVMRLFYPLILLLITQVGFSQKFTINGYVKDAANGEELIGVTVLVVGSSTGTVTNAYGFYSITLPPGKYDLQLCRISLADAAIRPFAKRCAKCGHGQRSHHDR